MTKESLYQELNEVEIPIYYEDTDFTGYVFHANYLKYLDRAREEIIGRSFLLELFQTGNHFVLSKASIDFHRPARFGDTLIICTEALMGRSPRIRFKHEVYRKDESKGTRSEKIISARLDLASIDGQGRPVRLPKPLIDRMVQQHDSSP